MNTSSTTADKRALKTLFRNPDNREGVSIDGQRPADHGLVAVKNLLPGPVAEDGDRLASRGLRIGGSESAAADHAHTQDIEEIRGHELPPDANRLGAFGTKTQGHAAEGDDVFEPLRAGRTHVEEVRIREAEVAPGFRRAAQRNQPVLLAHAAEAAAARGFDPAEDRRVGADAEAEYHHGDRRERGAAQNIRQAKLQIVGNHVGLQSGTRSTSACGKAAEARRNSRTRMAIG